MVVERVRVHIHQEEKSEKGGYHLSGLRKSVYKQLDDGDSKYTQMAMGCPNLRYWSIWCDSRVETVLHLDYTEERLHLDKLDGTLTIGLKSGRSLCTSSFLRQ